MTTKRPIKVKITGLARDVKDTIRELELYFLMTQTSDIIQHSDDDEAHAYLLILPEATR